jgi:hypothetical protein
MPSTPSPLLRFRRIGAMTFMVATASSRQDHRSPLLYSRSGGMVPERRREILE